MTNLYLIFLFYFFILYCYNIKQMGNSSSVPETCVYNKKNFDLLLNNIRDAHNVTEYYARLLLQPELPSTLGQYRSYADDTQDFFNPLRKNTVPDLGSSYQSFADYLNNFQGVYEKSEKAGRLPLIQDIFNKCTIVQQSLIDELYNTCYTQGVPSTPEGQ
jgi:hypothetical protein